MSTLMPESMVGHWIGGYEVEQQKVFLEVWLAGGPLSATGSASIKFEFKTDLDVVEIDADPSHIHFEIPVEGETLTFTGQLQDGALIGEMTGATKQGTFHLVKIADVDAERLDAYVGCYQVALDRAISVSNFRGELGCDYLVYLDLASGEIRALFPTSDTTFVAGPAFLVPFPMLVQVTPARDDQGRVTGLWWEENGQTLWAPRVEFRQEEVSFSNGEVTLAGTLKLPLRGGPHPGVVLIHGSGPQTRDYADLQFMSDFFAINGIAVLAYDKRGEGASTKDPGESTMYDLANDVLAGVALLRMHNEIDPDRIGLWGVSQGGWIAPTAAAHSQNVAFIILVSGPAVGVVQQDLDRVEYELRTAGYPEEEVEAAVVHERLFSRAAETGQGWEELEASINRVKEYGWSSLVATPSKEEFEQHGLRWGRFRAYDPLPSLEKTTCPVLAFFGGKDTVVPPERNVHIMKRALKGAGNKDFTIKVFPDANHTMLFTETGAIQEIPHRTRFVPSYFDTMLHWLLERISVSR